MVDNSPEGHGDYDHSELECYDGKLATETERGLKAALTLPETLAELNRKLTPLIGLEEKVDSINAAVQGGSRLELQYQQLVGILAHCMRRIEMLEDDLNGKNHGIAGTADACGAGTGTGSSR